MPAVTVDDITVLPRVRRPDPGLVPARPVASVTTAPSGFEGEGFPVRRAFAGVDQSLLDPFIMMDQMGEVEYAPGEPRGTSWHPHRGFETVTYIIDGSFIHQDSHGGGGVITNGDTQWMTAGSGLLHIETPPEQLVMSGGLFHGLQLWVNLPRSAKMNPPRYQDLARERASRCSRATTAARCCASSPASSAATPGPGSTYTPMTMVHATHRARRLDDHPVATRLQRARLRALGPRHGRRGAAPGAHRPAHGLRPRRQHHDQRRREPGLERARRLDVVLLGGEPIREPVAWYGPFVMNTQRELMQAVEDFQKGRLGVDPRRRHPALPRLTPPGAPDRVRRGRGHRHVRHAGPAYAHQDHEYGSRSAVELP